MTTTTVKRQITKLVRGVFEKYRDDLEREINMVEAVHQYIVGCNAGRPIAQVREEIFTAMQLGAQSSQVREAMETRIKSALGVDPGVTPSLWDTVIEFLIKKDADGQTIEKFASACQSDPYGMPKAHQIAQKPSLIQSMWLKAFPVQSTQTAQPDKDGGYH